MIALSELQNHVSKCRQCPLHRKCKGPVPGVGMSSSKIMVIGQAPEWQDDKERIAWVSPYGQYISEVLELLGWASTQVYYTNRVKCFPGRGQFGPYKPSAVALETCAQWLEQEIKLVHPVVILAVGAEVMKAFNIKGTITSNAGKVFDTRWGPVIPVLHPGGLNKDPKKASSFVTSLRIVETFINGFQTPPPFVKL